MPNGAGVAAVDVGSRTPSSWGVELRSAGGDASEGSTPDVLGTKKAPDPESEGVDVTEYLCRPVIRLLDEIEATLREDREEGVRHGEVCASEPALATCRRIAVKIAPWLAPSSGLKWAAFGEDTGGASLVLRSELTDRRVDFTISGDGLDILAVRIDENLTARSVPLAVDDRSSLRETAAWVDCQS